MREICTYGSVRGVEIDVYSTGESMDGPLDDFWEYDFVMGADTVKCPYCGADVPCSLFFDNEVKCPKCGKKFKQ